MGPHRKMHSTQNLMRRGLLIWAVLSLFFLGSGESHGADSSNGFNYFKVINPAKLQDLYGNTLTKSFVLDGSGADENILYQQIFDQLGAEYETIGRRQAALAMNNRGGFTIDGINNIGYSFHRDFADFKISLNRQLAPDLFDDSRWIVTDTFNVYIDASLLLSNLKDQEIIDISEQNLALFGGVEFKRTYTFTHFAPSYEDGLVLDLNKLFFAFKPFRAKSFLTDMDDYEFITKEDSLSVRAGGFVSAPLYSGVSGSAGFLARYERVAKSEILAVGPDDTPKEGERFRISFQTSTSAELGAAARINADFLGILKLTLLSYDFSYTATKSHTINLSLYENDLTRIETDPAFSGALDQVLKHRSADVDILAHNIVQEEYRRKEKISSKYAILILGGARDQETEQVKVIKDGVETNFFRHNSYRVSFTQNIFSRLMHELIKKYIGLSSVINKSSQDARRVRMSYESERNLIAAKEDFDVATKDALSMSFSRELYVAKTLKAFKSTKTKIVDLLADTGGLDPLAVTWVEGDLLVGPMTLKAELKVRHQAIGHFNALSYDQAFDYAHDVCGGLPKTIWEKFRSLFGGCNYRMQRAWNDYYTELTHTNISSSIYKSCSSGKMKWWWSKRKKVEMQKACMLMLTEKDPQQVGRDIPLWRLKDFAESLHRYSKHKLDFYNYFGLQNVFLYGKFDATTNEGGAYKANFSEGKFQGLGVIEDAKMLGTMGRAPASVVID